MATLAACGPAMGPTVRVATATPAQLAEVEDKDNVWYEFQAGDVIPVQLGFMGVMEGGSREAVFRAKQHFYFVMFQHAPMQISFESHIHEAQSDRRVFPPNTRARIIKMWQGLWRAGYRTVYREPNPGE